MARHFTPELAREVGKLGGRPAGVLSPKTIAKIKTKQAVEKIIQQKAGLIVEDLFRASKILKVEASKELLDRAFGKVPQGVQMQVATFSLKELAEYRKSLLQPPVETPAIDPQGVPQIALPDPDVLEEPKEDAQKKTI